ncbi:MAG: hypothetical protein A2W25_11615 [candidate division Zixibacteria bacterium RBG_16_53_22]|nr:MAG: hypothetical protein A2W25_11615 [candidate division Zixibacteria bacterium RBG_16_53_22]
MECLFCCDDCDGGVCQDCIQELDELFKHLDNFLTPNRVATRTKGQLRKLVRKWRSIFILIE